VPRLVPYVVVLAACAAPPKSDYVPGGSGLPRDARVDYRRAVELENRGRREEALDMLTDLAAWYPLRLGIHLHRLRLARDLQGPEAAARLYEPPPPGVDRERAVVLSKLARLDDEDVPGREAVLESALVREPDEAFWRLGVAHVRLTAHDIVVGRAHRERELGRIQASAESYAESVRILEEARQEAETALQLDPALKEAQLLLGFIATRRAELGADRAERDKWRYVAEHHYLEARMLDPECVSTRLNLAENYLYFDDYSSAADELEKAVHLAPNESRAWNNLGLTYYSTGRLDDAIRCYRRVLQLQPDNARTRTALSDCLLQRDASKALAELEKARLSAGEDRELQAEIAFKMGAIHEHERRYKQAIEHYQRHIDLGGKDSAKARSRIRHIFAG